MSAGGLKILYLAHDLADPAVTRRVVMLRDGGAAVTVAGFRRTAEPFGDVAGCAAINLGRTHNGRFVQRIWSVFREIFFRRRRERLACNANVIVARNLEMLAIAVGARAGHASPPVLVYESLDIHRLLLSKGPSGALLRRLEGWLSRRAAALITSSPAFVSAYFETLSKIRLPVRLVENKVYDPDGATSGTRNALARTPGPPWKIGWFGVIRCRKSLRMLAHLVTAGNGTIEVTIRGRPALDQIPDFHEIVAATPGLNFLGPYKNPGDLAAIYREIHFIWAIDLYEEGLNSSWLLPNRLYEGGLFDAVPVAIKSVATGSFLENLHIGVTLEEPVDRSLREFFGRLGARQYQELEAAMRNIPRSRWHCDKGDCEELVSYLGSLRKKHG